MLKNIHNSIIFKYIPNLKTALAMAMVLGITLTGCKKWYGVPDDTDYLSENITYTLLKFNPVLGRTTLMGNFSADNSTYPLTFEILNPRNTDGSPSTAFSIVKPVKVWTDGYTGAEKTLSEIEAKRKIENHPLFEVRKSGEFILWSGATNANFLKTGADSTYFYDVAVTNNGNRRVIRNLAVVPLRERPTEPSNNINPQTGAQLYDTDVPTLKVHLLPNAIAGMRGATTNRTLVRETRSTNSVTKVKSVLQDCYVYFNRKGDGNSLTFKFMDKDSVAIDPAKFNNTKWASLIHGFNMQMTTTSVKYDVAYPIPLIKMATMYTTTDGSQANVVFSYNRIGFSGARETGTMNLTFNIFQEGDWEIIFFFHNETPKFENE
jgi:hypothetical protein